MGGQPMKARTSHAITRPWITRTLCVITLASLPLVCIAAEPRIQILAQKSGNDDSQIAAKKRPRPDAKRDAENESEALELVDSHLPNLSPMLESLRTSHPKSYRKAINDLSRSAKRLAAAKKRDVSLYEIEVHFLKARSEVNLLTAKLKVRDNKNDRLALRKAVNEMSQTQVDRARYEVTLQERRLETAKKQLEAAKSRLKDKQNNFENQTESAFRRSLKTAGRDEKQSK